MICLAVALNHLRRHILWVTKRCIAARFRIRTAFAATAASAVSVVGAGAVAGISGDGIPNEDFPNLVVAEISANGRIR